MGGKLKWDKKTPKAGVEVINVSTAQINQTILRKHIVSAQKPVREDAPWVTKTFHLKDSKVPLPSSVKSVVINDEKIIILMEYEYSLQDDANIRNEYFINKNKIKSEYEIHFESIQNGDIIKFKNFGYSVVLWKNSHRHISIKSESGNYIIYHNTEEYIEFSGIEYNKKSDIKIIKENKKVMMSNSVYCHICHIKFDKCYSYTTNLKVSPIFHICTSCKANILKIKNHLSVTEVLEKSYHYSIDKKCSLKFAIDKICENCQNKYTKESFFPKFSREEKEKIYAIMKKEKLDFGFACNVFLGRYSLEIAKQRQRLKERKRNGKSVDIFSVARRRSGSFK